MLTIAQRCQVGSALTLGDHLKVAPSQSGCLGGGNASFLTCAKNPRMNYNYCCAIIVITTTTYNVT